jgi:type II secretory pathway pseudopilin PulG
VSKLRSSEGFTMIEVMTALFIVLAVISALALVFATNDRSSLSSQLQVSRLSVLQQQVEKVRNVVSQYGFSALALNANPSPPTDSSLPNDPVDPDDFITGYGTSSEAFRVESNYNNTSEGLYQPPNGEPSNGEPLLDPHTGVGTGQLSPVQCVDLSTPDTPASCSALASGTDAYATVYTYITQTNAVGCKTGANCTGDARRVIVAVLLHHPGSLTVSNGQTTPTQNLGPNTPTYSTVVITNPLASDYPTSASGLRILGRIP